MLGYFCFTLLIWTVVLVSRCHLLDWCAVLSGGVFLEVLSFWINRMGMFLVSGFFNDRDGSFCGFVILFV